MFQRAVDYPGELANGYHLMLDSEVLVTVGGSRWNPPPLIKPPGDWWSSHSAGTIPGMVTILDIGVGICKATGILVGTLVCSGIYFVAAVFAVGAYGDTHGLWGEDAAMAITGALSAFLILYVWFVLADLDNKFPRGRVLALVLSPFALGALLLAPLGVLAFLVYMVEIASM